MGLHDRPYMRRQAGEQPYGGGPMSGMTVGLPRPAQVVKLLLIVNIAVYVLQMFLDKPTGFSAGGMSRSLGVTVGGFWQLWRYLTFQFLHGGVWHIALNMLGLWLLGSPLERHWGSRRFAVFYLTCGAVAGVAYVVIGAASDLGREIPIIGASGGVYGVLLACAVFFPNFRIIFLFFPVPIRLAALVIFGAMILMVLQALAAGAGAAAMSDVAHLGGAVAAAVWVWAIPGIQRRMLYGADGKGQGRWQQKLRRQQAQQAQIDRILDQIRRDGIGSLSWSQKRKLRKASRQRQQQR